ncbi:Flagellar motor switch phosphatase FliY [Tepidanaerobacter acetatoxydans Re1]|uniref:Flagellar motor switch phosphatase FliY n=1 Tax=Tepidanaerobacter acetatoxydans (strain DSM 21804 / JCM 16047 / Re1) TaxID=1209989 RepID=F4LTQ0_TEPAE|nr:flagellar motor switch phosphatase FliY [Tepidanaerobacter acetatoxydans]AEE91380.1 CheC, inhibitor of MCP methylation / FliN fusion protein [Tepidanaerobacter acetatoxydans Re1]CCP26077.1 Flagellar motor switch phosphatase FliY [Tepidanaerobacter acetatoxydans Re1]
MDDQLLSSEEIKELMNGAAENVQITREEMDALGEIGNISIGTSATTLYSLLRNKVVITTPKVYITNIKKLKEAYPIPFISIEVSYTKGLNGSTLMIMKEDDAKIIADLMMGGDGSNVDVELDDIRMSAVGEAMNQMMGSAATSLSIMLKKDINISPPRVTRINLATDSLKGYFDEDEDIVTISFKMEVGDFLKSEIMQLMPIPFAKSLVEQLYTLSLSETTTNTDSINNEKINEEPKQIHSEQTSVRNITEQEAVLTMPQKEPLKSAQNAEVTVKPVEFHTFKEEPTAAQSSSLNLILDVPLEVTVELGRTEKTIKEILEISSGTIIELDKMAGEPADILVNGKLVAKGEVVVIDENFGVRITEIINSVDRVKSLQ